MVKRVKISKRTKIISIVFATLIVLFFGVVTILARTGVINIRMLADSLTGSTTQNVVITAIDQSNRAVVGVLAGATKLPSGTPFTGITDSTGKWITTLENGNYNFTVAASPECQGILNNQIVTSAVTNFTIKISCSTTPDPAKAIIKGKVLDKSTASAIVTASVTTDVGSYSVITGSDGSYQLSVDPGVYNLTATKSGFHQSGSPINTGSLKAGTTFNAPNILMGKDSTTGGTGGVVGTDNFDVFGNVVLDSSESTAIKANIKLACSYISKDGKVVSSPATTISSSDTFQTVNSLKYNFRFESLPKKYNDADFQKCYLSIIPGDGSVLDSYGTTEVSYTTTNALGKIANLPPIGKDAAYFYKIGLKIKDGKNSLRVMGKITNSTGQLANNVNVSLSSASGDVSTTSVAVSQDPKPFNYSGITNYKFDLANFTLGSELKLNLFGAGIQPQTIDIADKIKTGSATLQLDSIGGYYIVVDTSVNKNPDVAMNMFTGNVATKYQIRYSDSDPSESSIPRYDNVANATIKYTISNLALKYSSSGQLLTDSSGNFVIDNIPVSTIASDSGKMIEINLIIDKDGYKELTNNEKYANSVKPMSDNFTIELQVKENYQMCIHAVDKNNKPLNYSRVLVVVGDVGKLSTRGDYFKGTGMLVATFTESLVQNGNWSMSLENFREVLIHSGGNLTIDPSVKFSLFIIPWNEPDDKYFPVNRSLLVDGLELIKMTGGIIDTYLSASCENVKVNFDSPVEPTNNYTIDLYDAETGNPINAKDENAIISIGNIFSDNTERMVDGSYYTQEYSSAIMNRLTIKIKSTRDISRPKLLYYSGEHYKLIDSGVDIGNSGFPLKLYLLNYNRANSGMTCVEYSGFKFCGLKIPTMDILTGEQKLTLEKIAKVLSAIKTAASDTRSVPIYIQTKPFDRARAHSSSIGINHAAFNGSSAYFSLAYTELNSYPRLLETAVHEYAHTIDFMSGLSEKDKYKFDQITIEGNTEIARTMMINNNCCGEKQFPDLYYAERTNSLELWAQFFTWWYLHNDEFRKAIAVDSPVSEPCKQVLKFMYAVLQQTFPSVIPYDQVTTTSAANADVQVGVRQIPALLTASGSSPGSIDAIMLEAGFKKTSQLIKTESVVPLTSTVFTSDQIINGNWVKANYSKASFSDKVAVQYQAMTSTIKSSIIAQNISNLATTAINKFNQAYDALLKEFGWYRNTGNVKGTIVDESGVGIANMTVEFAGKYALTDQKGAYSITNVQSGETEVDSVKDLYTQEEYTILNPDRITITASRTAQITSKIKFIKVKLSGKITSKNGTAQKNFKILFTGPGGRKFEATSDVNGDYSLDGLYYEQYNVSVYSGKTAQSLDSLSKTVTPKKTIQGSNIVNFNVQLAK